MFRIPFSSELDGGAGEFSPIDKYLQHGWQSVRDAYINNDKQARKEEEKMVGMIIIKTHGEKD